MLFWLFVYSDEFLSILNITESLEIPFYYVFIEIVLDMIMVYINLYILLPRFFLKARVFMYSILTIISILVVIFANWVMYEMGYSDYPLAYFVSDFVTNVALIMMAVAFNLIGLMYLSESNIQELKKTNLQTELAYLKTQVNPHFLFNTLNNLFIMSKKADKQTPDAILQLSDLLRYQLYDCESDYVSIDKEIEYLRNYIELERLRRQDLDIKFDISEGLASHKIRPLILLPFVENAFKYSNTGDTRVAFIHIVIEIKDGDFVFTCKNNVGIIKASEVGGIGLTNATRRLELSYPNAHQLDIQNENQTFFVSLKIQWI